jgi:predicted nucleic acid-binding protein
LDETPVVNASPLIHLTRAGHAELLRVVGERIAVPQPVADEILAMGPDDVTARSLDRLPWLEVVPPPEVPPAVAVWDLGPGESSVIAWALAHPGSVAIIDDLQGRRCALSLHVPLIGTLGIALLAKRKGAISRARTVVEELVSHGMYLSPDVVDSALALVGE